MCCGKGERKKRVPAEDGFISVFEASRKSSVKSRNKPPPRKAPRPRFDPLASASDAAVKAHVLFSSPKESSKSICRLRCLGANFDRKRLKKSILCWAIVAVNIILKLSGWNY
jgi:hypothetical protein